MCNLYSMTKSQKAILELTRAMADSAGNLPVMDEIFPDFLAPVVFEGVSGRELTRMRWGLPGPDLSSGRPVTNVRNTASPYWRRWLGVEHRCLVMVDAFCEWADTKPRKTPVWFALDGDRKLFAFAGIWTRWTGTRGTKAEPVSGVHRLFGFLTAAPNAEVRAVHPLAMPVVLESVEEMEVWLRAGWEEAAKLQRGLRDGGLQVVERRTAARGVQGSLGF